ncbi:hypothetical protein ABPG74_019127 [Tetrahymena malaccensis]
MVSENDKRGQIIKGNVMYLALLQSKGSERNMLNKWFQDSVKNYILDQIATPLIAQYLNCSTTSRIKNFILKNLDKTKPKYMSIMEQYFILINKYSQGDQFVERLNQQISEPIDYSIKQFKSTYNNQKIIRKKFVCYLILRYFELFKKCQFPSFYELWNYCFPEEIQMKKKLSKFDPKSNKKSKSASNQNNQDSFYSSECISNSSNCFSIINQANSFDYESHINSNYYANVQSYEMKNNTSDLYQTKYQENDHFTQKIQHYPQKQQINNHIFEDHNEEEEQQEEFHYISSWPPLYQNNNILNNQHKATIA